MTINGANSYIPQGGVWTAEERNLVDRSGAFELEPGEPQRAASTVAALVAALEALVGDEGWIEDHEDETAAEHEYCAYCSAHALLAAVKEEK
jgi:hypothetical protein